jgi:hypothetical protein
VGATARLLLGVYVYGAAVAAAVAVEEDTSAPVHSASREVMSGKVWLLLGSSGCRQVGAGQMSGYPVHQLAAWPIIKLKINKLITTQHRRKGTGKDDNPVKESDANQERKKVATSKHCPSVPVHYNAHKWKPTHNGNTTP